MMRRSRHAANLFLLAALATALASPAHAEKSDKEKPINFSADQPAEVDFEKRVGTLKGNVVITQGTLSIKADRIDFKQNADNSLSATAYGNPISFRQKKDDSDEFYEGFAQKAVYDGTKDLLELFDRALLRQSSDEIRSNYISYNTRASLSRRGGETAHGRRSRIEVRGTFSPNPTRAVVGRGGQGSKDRGGHEGQCRRRQGQQGQIIGRAQRQERSEGGRAREGAGRAEARRRTVEAVSAAGPPQGARPPAGSDGTRRSGGTV
jgi:lipopolysaccharide export system protein LptA